MHQKGALSTLMKELFIHISQQGIHGLYLMIFTLLIWLVFFLILAANPHNKLNRWCFFTGLIFSIGTFKEFLYYELGSLFLMPVTHAIPDWLYSILSGFFYFFSMPCGLVFALYFSHADTTSPKTFRVKQIFCFIPALLMFFVFPCTQILYYQDVQVFCLSVAAYNWFYGIILTVLLLRTIQKERLSAYYHQRTLVTTSILLPLWCWLIMAFPYHAIGLKGFSKTWQLNLLIVFVILLFIIYHAFHEGIWGLRIRREQYNWSTGEKILQKNAHYVRHALKNDLAKIAWCTELLSQSDTQEHTHTKELDIIRQSISHLELFLTRTQLYSDKIVLKLQFCNVAQLFEDLVKDITLADHKQLTIDFCDPEPLLCDPVHLKEVLRNLISNAEESIEEDGYIKLTYHCQKRRRQAIISVHDNGCGIEKKDVKKLSEPFYTTKNTHRNMGLGLYYCWNVMCAHSGRMQVHSVVGKGSTFSLYFPYVNINAQKGNFLWKKSN